MTHRFVALLAMATLAVGPVTAQDHAAATAETSAEVPALSEMHEVIYPLWHTAWPAKDVAMMKELLPQVQQHVAAIEKAELPGILRDKRAAWATQVDALRGTLAAYEKAAAGDDAQALLDAVEALHARYEMMVRTIRPVMKELDAYHQVLYTVYHRLMPEKQLAELPGAADRMATACSVLAGAAVPKRFAEKEAALKASFAELCTATDGLKAVAATGDAEKIAAAVESVHSQYQKTEKLFE